MWTTVWTERNFNSFQNLIIHQKFTYILDTSNSNKFSFFYIYTENTISKCKFHLKKKENNYKAHMPM